MNMHRGLLACFGVMVLSLPLAAHAALVTLSGDTVDFIFDDADPGLQMYGTLTAVGDSIFATPSEIRAESTNIMGAILFNATGSIQVRAKDGYQLASITVIERGDYQMSAGAQSVGVSGWLSATNLYDFLQSESVNMNITGDLTQKGTVGPVNWTGDGSLDFMAGLWEDTLLKHITLTLQNNLVASSLTEGEWAWIQKKFTGGAVDVVIETVAVVPVPAAVWLLGSGLLGLVGVARRRKT